MLAAPLVIWQLMLLQPVVMTLILQQDRVEKLPRKSLTDMDFIGQTLIYDRNILDESTMACGTSFSVQQNTKTEQKHAVDF